jgi:hypothetical protein
MRLTTGERHVYQAVYKALSVEAFTVPQKTRAGRALANQYPEFKGPIAMAYIDAIVDYISPEVNAWLARATLRDVLAA